MWCVEMFYRCANVRVIRKINYNSILTCEQLISKLMYWQQMKAVFFCLILLLSHVHTQQDNTYFFNAEVTRLMDILINSLYTQKEIFLREVISNGSDALDKIRFLSLTDPDVLGETKDLELRIEINEEEKYIQFRDTGVGMTRAELIQNLGTVAKSGTTNYLSALKEGKINLIGQFGVGFYSTFLVGKKVVVISKSNHDDQHIWVSESAASFTVEKDPEGNTLGRGTVVRIYLKEDALQFLSHKKVSKLVKRYSEFIDFPIYINNKKEVEEEVPVETPESTDDLEVKEKTEETKKQKVKKTVWEWQRINNNKAIWLRQKDDIYDDDYIDFYKSISRQSNPPLNWVHFNTQGQIIFTAILYIPNRAPYDFYNNYNTRKNEIKLYVRRVLIAEQHSQLIPKYFSFVLGVIDSNDISVNVNRETLQQQKSFKVINQRVTKKILDMIGQIAAWEDVTEDEYEQELQENSEGIALMDEEELKKKKEAAKEKLLKERKERYQNFYTEFGKAIKLGILEDKTNRKKLASLSRWHTTRNPDGLTSFDEYIKKMKPVQDQIYFFSGEDRKVLEKSPLVKGLVKKGYEVLLCDDPIDQYVFNVLREYEGKNIVNVGKGDFKMPDDGERERKVLKYLGRHYQPYVDYAKKILFEKVNNVVISNRLTNEPCVVVADTYGHSSFMDKIQKAQMFNSNSDDNPVSDFKKILEINPHHKVNQIILERINNNETNTEVEELVTLLYETAAFNSGFSAKDSNEFVRRFYEIYSKAMGVISLQRKEVSVEDVELGDEDYQGENQDIIRVNPSQMKVQAAAEE